MAPWRRLLSGGGALVGVALTAGVGLAQDTSPPAVAPLPQLPAPVPAPLPTTNQGIAGDTAKDTAKDTEGTDPRPVPPPAPPVPAQAGTVLPPPPQASTPLPRAKHEAQAAPAANSEGTVALSPPATVPPPPPDGSAQVLVPPSETARAAPATGGVATPAPDPQTPLATMRLPPTVPAPAGPIGPSAAPAAQKGMLAAPAEQTGMLAAPGAPDAPEAAAAVQNGSNAATEQNSPSTASASQDGPSPAPAAQDGSNAASATQSGPRAVSAAQVGPGAAPAGSIGQGLVPTVLNGQEGATDAPAGPPAIAGVAGSADGTPAVPSANGLAFAPDAEVLIEMEIIPVLDRLADRALTLQNAVLRHCLVGHDITRDALEPAYVYAIEASAAVLPLSFGFHEAVIAPDRLLTNAISTAFSTSKLDAVMHGEAPVPRTLAELANEEAALLGLPALEILLMRRRYPPDVALKNRCTLAVPVAANIVDTAVRARLRWLNREVAPHWQGDRPDLAARLRLRDLIQGTIDTVDRVSHDLMAFQRMPHDKSAFRFTRARHGLVYLIAAAESLRSHVRRLDLFAEKDSGAAVLLGEIRDALTISCLRLLAIATGAKDDGAYLIAFEQAHGDIINELPQAFGFDGSAFSRALTSIEVPQASSAPP